MNAPEKKATEYVTVERSLLRSDRENDPEEDLEKQWFAQPVSGMRRTARPASVPPTGDEEVDSWLR